MKKNDFLEFIYFLFTIIQHIKKMIYFKTNHKRDNFKFNFKFMDIYDHFYQIQSYG
jgi:hypothetical protein